VTSLDGRLRSGPGGPDDASAAEDPAAPPATGAPVAAADAATVRRARPSRTGQTGGLPASAPPADVPAEPPRRPVPPTFPSPGQPPPGVARRAGRHARPEAQGGTEPPHTPPDGYRPRHAASDAETEQFAAVPATGPGGAGPAPVRPATPVALPRDDGPPSIEVVGGDRVRVVLAERRSPTRAVRTVAEIEQQTETGELLLGNLLRAQLTLGLRLGAVAVLLLGALPVLFLVLPDLGAVSVGGVRLPWLLLGVAPYPVMLVLAWLYTRTAERNELDFADNVED
jgi:hypothetical protein